MSAPLDLLSELVEAAFVDEHDARGVVTMVFVDLAANPDGSNYLRWRSELLRTR